MNPTFVKATKQQRKLRLALVGYEGTGKTYSALEMASAMARARDKDEGGIAVIDTENGSSAIYADKFSFDTLMLTEHSPEAYIEAIKAAIAAKYDVLIIDSLSHEWMGKGGALEQVDNIGGGDGNKFRAWGNVTPRHRAVFERISSAPLHVITTMRQKKAYVQETDDRTKKTVIRNVGTEPIQREGSEFESDVIGVLDQDNTMRITKSRIASLQGKSFHRPGKEVAELMLADLRSGAEAPTAAAEPVATPPAPTAKIIAPATEPVAPLSNAKTPDELKAMAARETAPKTKPLMPADSLPAIRGDVVRLYNAHFKEAAAYITSNNLPKAVADMTREQVTELRDYLVNLAGVTA